MVKRWLAAAIIIAASMFPITGLAYQQDAILHVVQRLDLTPEERERIEGILAFHEPGLKERVRAVTDARKKILLKTVNDSDAVVTEEERAVDRLAQARDEAIAKREQEIRETLPPQKRARFELGVQLIEERARQVQRMNDDFAEGRLGPEVDLTERLKAIYRDYSKKLDAEVGPATARGAK